MLASLGSLFANVRMRGLAPRALCAVLLVAGLPAPSLAQRELHWATLGVTAHLNADGSLAVVEEQAIVFTGDWNGGERIFNVRPGQSLRFEGLSRWADSGWQALRESSDLAEIDTYAVSNGRTLRWRSRRTSDPPFDKTTIRYQIRYSLSGILNKDGDRYTLDHDFAFPDRTGTIERLDVRLTLDAAWQPSQPLPPSYTASGLPPGRSFVVTVPLRYTGTGAPEVRDLSRPWRVVVAVLALLILPLVWVATVLRSEQAKGRFVPLATDGIDAAWLRTHVLNHPAEVISAAWDDNVGQAEVVTLLARLESEGTLSTRTDGDTLKMQLKANRESLQGYERALIDGLFFNGRSSTSTDDVKAHYKSTGFKPVSLIEEGVRAAAQAAFPLTKPAKLTHYETLLGLLGGTMLGIMAWMSNELPTGAVFGLPIGALVVSFLASIGGTRFRSRLDLGLDAAIRALLVPLGLALLAAWLVWKGVGPGQLDLSVTALASVVALVLGAVSAGIHSLRSLQTREGVAFRKTLTAGRAFMEAELRKPNPALEDSWYPWLLAFELQTAMDQWSVANPSNTRRRHDHDFGSGSSSTGSSSSWSGYGGGRSGGGGGGAAWAAAAGGLASGVAAPSSSSSSGGSSSGGSSGGGGGGGW